MGLFSKKDKSSTSLPPSSASSTKSPAGDDSSRSELFGRRASPSPSDHSGPPPSYRSNNANPYAAAENPYGSAPPVQRPGPNRQPSTNTLDASRNELFGGAAQRRPAPTPSPNSYGSQDGRSPSSESAGGGYSNGLTAEDEEEEDVDEIKQQLRFTKQETVGSTRNALRIAAQAEETGRGTLERLGAQGERLYNTERNLDKAAEVNRTAEAKSRELKTLNGSMFAIHTKNPFQKGARDAQREKEVLERHQMERDVRDESRRQAFQGKQNVGAGLKGKGGYQASKASMAERSKYQFENDEEDDDMENEIDSNLNQLGNITGRLKNLAVATGQEVDRQKQTIDVLQKKTDKVDDQIAVTHSRIKRIH